MDTPANLVIVRDFDDDDDEQVIPRFKAKPMELPSVEDFSFSSVLEQSILAASEVETEIDSILNIMTDALNGRMYQLTGRQNDINKKMAHVEKLSSSTFSKTSSYVNSSQSVIKNLKTRSELLAFHAERSFELVSSVVTQIHSIESHLPERERLSSPFSDHASQYPRLHKLLLSTRKLKPITPHMPSRVLSFPVNAGLSSSTMELTRPYDSAIAASRTPRRVVSYTSLAVARDSSDFAPLLLRTNTSADYPLPALTLRSVVPSRLAEGTSALSIPAAEADSASTISQATARSTTFTLKSFVGWGKSHLRTRNQDEEDPSNASAQQLLRNIISK